LEDAFRDAFAEVADGDTARLDELIDSQGHSEVPAQSSSFRPTDPMSETPVPRSGIRERETKHRAV